MQEARGTARALREEVGQLKTGQERVSSQAPPVDSMLDALDGAIEMMSALEVPTGTALAHGKDRRGRIDIAALLFDIAPNAKIGIEPGAGTEVFGVELELRRVLALLVKQSGSDTNTSAAIDVRRESDWVVVSVGIGPEGMSTRDLEHRWLNRMATRHGGRVELSGNVTRLYLPADTSSGQQEILQLRKELEQAQQLGAVYARELAEAFAVSTDAPASVMPDSKRTSEPPLRILVSSTASVVRLLRSTTDALRLDVARAARALGEHHEIALALSTRLIAYGELISDLERIAQVPLDEPPRMIDLAVLLRQVTDSADARARRHDVALILNCDPTIRLSSRPQVLGLLVRSLLDQAIASTPRSGSVEVVAGAGCESGVLLSIVDGGPIVPEGAHEALLLGLADPSAIGRPGALSWTAAGAAARTLGINVEVGVSSNRRSEVRLAIPVHLT